MIPLCSLTNLFPFFISQKAYIFLCVILSLGDNKMPRKAKDSKVKSAQELETAYIEKVEHSMERIVMWSQKLSKLVASKKGYLTDDDKQKLIKDYGEVAEATLEAMQSRETKSETFYKLR